MARTPNVRVVNLPKKDKWDKLQIVVTILSLFVAIFATIFAGVSTYLYVGEISKEPDISLSVFSPGPVPGKAIFKFDNGEWSSPLEVNIGLNNKGNRKSESLSKFYLFFDQDAKVSRKSGSYWKVQTIADIKRFYYVNHKLILNANTHQWLGVFDLSIPKRSKKYLIALFLIEGDFDKKTGLLYYDYIKQVYIVEYHHEQKTKQIWNEHLRSNAGRLGKLERFRFCSNSGIPFKYCDPS